MPTPGAILLGLHTIANQWLALAVVWHALFGALLLSLIAGWRPSNRLLAVLLIAPLASVSALAWTSGNPFNGAVFAALALGLLGLRRRLSDSPVETSAAGAYVLGVLLVGFAWVYPHFLETSQWTTYAYAAPLGLIPCPTLSAVLGTTLLLRFLGSRPWSLALGAAGLFYGLIGVFILGVTIDIVLLLGAVTLAVLAAARR
jgi:hypothetical protein